MHARWIAFLKRFVFIIQRKPGDKNQVSDSLSHRAHSLTVLQMSISVYDCLKEFYILDGDFKVAWQRQNHCPSEKYIFLATIRKRRGQICATVADFFGHTSSKYSSKQPPAISLSLRMGCFLSHHPISYLFFWGTCKYFSI